MSTKKRSRATASATTTPSKPAKNETIREEASKKDFIVHQSNKNSTKTALLFNFPIFGIEWLKEDNTFVVGGGGGSKFGIPNRLVVLRYDKCTLKIDQLSHVDLPQAVWSMSNVVWKPTSQLVVGFKDSVACALVDAKNHQVSCQSSVKVVSSETGPSKKTVALSKCGHFAVVTQDDFSLVCMSFQSNTNIMFSRGDTFKHHKERINDVSLLSIDNKTSSKATVPSSIRNSSSSARVGSWLLVATASDDGTLCLWLLQTAAKANELAPTTNMMNCDNNNNIVTPEVILSTSDVRSDKCVFKFCKLVKTGGEFKLFAVTTGYAAATMLTVFRIKVPSSFLHAHTTPTARTPSKVNKNSASSSSSSSSYSSTPYSHGQFILEKIISKKITNDAVTAFSMSWDGSMICCGDNEGNVFVLDSVTLATRNFFRELHDSPITGIQISNDKTCIISTDLQYFLKVTKRYEHHWLFQNKFLLFCFLCAFIFTLFFLALRFFF